MAEININSQRHSKKYRRKYSDIVDLTPMVDLGFILITFFIFSTSMSYPVAMKLRVPKDTIKDSTRIPESNTLNILIAGNHKIYYYSGTNTHDIKSCRSEGKEIRNIIFQKRNSLTVHKNNYKEFIILIKPMEESSYKEVVDVLDEMIINQIKTYFLTEPDIIDINIIQQQTMI